MSNEVFFKPSLNIDSFFGDEFFEDNERFLLFLKAYYEWLQTTTITIVNKTGTFTRGEQIVGATSKATATIREVKDGFLVVQLNTKKPFAKSETVTGQTSSATATTYEIKDNVVRASGNVVDYRHLETSIDKYFAYLKDELYTSLPIDFYGNKPLIASKFKDFFTSKSNEQSYRFLFRLLYNEEIDFYYPGDDIIRVSDGNFEKTQVIRVTATGFGIDNLGNQYERNIFDFLNKTIRGETSGALGFVVDIKKFFIGAIETAELTLRLVSADFEGGENIVDVDDADLNATVYGIVAGFTINDGGSGYQVGDVISITGDGAEAQAVVSSIKQSPITALKVNTVGHGYRLGTTATINNSGTGGSGLIVRVTELANTYTVTNANTGNTYTVGEISEISVINRGSGYFSAPTITLLDSTIESLGLLTEKLVTINNPGTNYTVGDALIITANTGANAVGQVASVVANSSFSNNLVFEDGFSLLFEQSYDDVLKTEDWAVGSIGPIRRIEFTNFGNGYSDDYPPTITVSSGSGSNASFTVTGIQGMSANVEVDTANNVTGIGSIRAVELTNFGINYTSANADATGVGDGNANLTPIISGIGVSTGSWLDDDGKVSYKILQDSYYYQDYSYVIKSGLTVEKYIDTIKKSIHPAGLQVFGNLLLIDTVTVTPEFKSSIETIKDFIVRIYDFITIAPVFGEFDITIETTIESFIPLQVSLIPNTDIATQEYVIQVVQGGDDVHVRPSVAVSLDKEIRVIAPNQINAEMEVEIPPVRKLYISTIDIHDGYTISSSGGLGERFIEEFANEAISLLENEIFGGLPGSLSGLGETVVFLVRGGDDLNKVEDLEISLPFDTSQLVYRLELFWDNAVAIIYNEVTFAETGTDLVVVDKITFIDTSVSHSITEIMPELNLVTNVESSNYTEYNLEVYTRGNRYTVFGENLLNDYSSNTITSLSDVRFETSFGSTENREINAFISPHPSGQSEGEEQFSDIFRTRIKFEIKPSADLSVRSNELLVSSETNTIEFKREIPVLIHADVEFATYQEYVIPIESLGFANSEFTMIIASSSVTPQKLQSSENLVYAYGIRFADLLIGDYAGTTFNDEGGEGIYQADELLQIWANSQIGDYFRTYPASFSEYVKIIPSSTNFGEDYLDTDRQVKVEIQPAIGYGVWGDYTISEYETDPISVLAERYLGGFEEFTTTGTAINVSPSQWPLGQNPTNVEFTDVFFKEYQIKPEIDRYANYMYEELYISVLSDEEISLFSSETLDENYEKIPTQLTVNKYQVIAGTVSSTVDSYDNIVMAHYANTQIQVIGLSSISANASVVIGTSTDFVSDFAASDEFIANNELFAVETIANTTYMVVDRFPSSPYSNILAYKQI